MFNHLGCRYHDTLLSPKRLASLPTQNSIGSLCRRHWTLCPLCIDAMPFSGIEPSGDDVCHCKAHFHLKFPEASVPKCDCYPPERTQRPGEVLIVSSMKIGKCRRRNISPDTKEALSEKTVDDVLRASSLAVKPQASGHAYWDFNLVVLSSAQAWPA